MFSYLRPHRRTPSNPSSPVPEQSPAWEASSRPPPTDHGHPQRYPGTRPSEPSAPSLAPLAHVVSAERDHLLDANGARPRAGIYGRDPENQNAEDTHTISNRPRKPVAGMGTQRLEYAGNAAPAYQTSFQHSRPVAINHDFTQGPRTADQNPSFVKESTGTRLATPPPSAANAISAFETSRAGKRLNLLNPMALLARRRANQYYPQGSTESIMASGRASNNFNDSFDPRIRGTVVHDFSAPRPKRVVPTNAVLTDVNKASAPKQYQQSTNTQPGGQSSTDYSHTAAFTEDFEEQQYPASGPHVRKASDLSDLTAPKPHYAEESQWPSNLSSRLSNNDGAEKQLPRKPVASNPEPGLHPVLSKGADQPSSEARRISIDPASTSQKSTPSKKGQSRKASNVSIKDSERYPKHMKSTSSRFSFDMIGAAEQERLLEDRHRQRALEKENEKAEGDNNEFDDDFDYDNMDDDDDLEERIPGVNADYDDDDEPYNYFQQPLATPLTPYNPRAANASRDINSDDVGFDTTENPSTDVVPDLNAPSGRGIAQVYALSADARLSSVKPRDPVVPEPSQPTELENDDLYYDDGIIEELDKGHKSGEFDESVFDNVDTDEYGRPLKTLLPLPTLYSPPTLPPDPAPFDTFKASGDNLPSRRRDTVSTETGPRESGLASQPSMSTMGSGHTVPEPSHLTQDTLAAYQSALAAAAMDAAANGKFRRDSVQTLPTASEHEDTQPGLISDSSHTSHYEAFSPNYDFEDDFDYDDALEDDPIIAAANAEALANDMDGFYGQEFGFYSAPSAGEAEYANGGYFGPRGIEGIGRSTSGRIVSREPNLTPITERSEYSNRNSFMSGPMHSAGSAVPPGLAQLAGMLEYEGDMSLDALLKLRRGAWGGSQASLHSSNESPRSAAADEASPVGQPPYGQVSTSTLPMGGHVHKRQNSAFSGFSITSDGASATAAQGETSPVPGSPTVMVPMPTSAEGVRDQEKEKDKDAGSRRHRYTTSAESISYSKEDDPQSPTGERWVLERRRTSGNGVELLGREVISGGMI